MKVRASLVVGFACVGLQPSLQNFILLLQGASVIGLIITLGAK